MPETMQEYVQEAKYRDLRGSTLAARPSNATNAVLNFPVRGTYQLSTGFNRTHGHFHQQRYYKDETVPLTNLLTGYEQKSAYSKT